VPAGPGCACPGLVRASLRAAPAQAHGVAGAAGHHPSEPDTSLMSVPAHRRCLPRPEPRERRDGEPPYDLCRSVC
jgi:hypothetical protein